MTLSSRPNHALQPPVFRLRANEKTLLARHLAHLVASGTPLASGLRLLARSDLGSGTLRRHAEVLALHVESGEQLSTAMSLIPGSFTPDDIAPLAAAESTGRIESALSEWARLCAARERISTAVRSATPYPTCVVLVIVGSASLIAWKVMPTFSALFHASGVAMHWSAGITDRVVSAATIYGPLVTTLLLVLLLLRFTLRRSPLACAWDRAELALPVVGALQVAATRASMLGLVAGFARTGRGLDDAFHHAARGERNAWLRWELDSAAKRITAGERLSARGLLLDRRTVHALSAALAAHDVGPPLSRLADREVERFARAAGRVASLIPSVAILVVGFVAGVLLVGWYVPILTTTRLVP